MPKVCVFYSKWNGCPGRGGGDLGETWHHPTTGTWLTILPIRCRLSEHIYTLYACLDMVCRSHPPGPEMPHTSLKTGNGVTSDAADFVVSPPSGAPQCEAESLRWWTVYRGNGMGLVGTIIGSSDPPMLAAFRCIRV